MLRAFPKMLIAVAVYNALIFGGGLFGHKSDGLLEQNFLLYSSVPMIAHWLESFKEFPPRSKPASFSIDRIMEMMMPKDGAIAPKEEPKKTKRELVAEYN